MIFRRSFGPIVGLTILAVSSCQPANQQAAHPPVHSQDASGPSYAQVAQLLRDKCTNCHQPDNFAPFPLTNYDEFFQHRGIIEASLRSGSMPPWQAANDCRPYRDNYSMSDEQKNTVLSWLQTGAPRGSEEATIQATRPPPPIDFNLVLKIPEPYTPQTRPDDYRCFVIEWPQDLTETRYITAFALDPDKIKQVHHVLAYVTDQSESIRALDDASEGVGYECFGGPIPEHVPEGVPPIDRFQVRQIASWVPGVGNDELPAGTGIPVEPGSTVVVQIHYNTIVEQPQPDQSALKFRIATQVDRPAQPLLWTNAAWFETGSKEMHIPAGESSVTHRHVATFESIAKIVGPTIGVGEGEPLAIHTAGLHMHLLGANGRSWIERQGGDSECLLDIKDWDFGWQQDYKLEKPLVVQPEDRIGLSCTWDNSASNQPFVNGKRQDPRPIYWGEGSTDEMCLVSLYISAP